MIPELGHFALILALAMAFIQSSFPLVGATIANQTFMALARPVARLQFFFVVISFFILAYSFLINDFSISYNIYFHEVVKNFSSFTYQRN